MANGGINLDLYQKWMMAQIDTGLANAIRVLGTGASEEEIETLRVQARQDKVDVLNQIAQVRTGGLHYMELWGLDAFLEDYRSYQSALPEDLYSADKEWLINQLNTQAQATGQTLEDLGITGDPYRYSTTTLNKVLSLAQSWEAPAEYTPDKANLVKQIAWYAEGFGRTVEDYLGVNPYTLDTMSLQQYLNQIKSQWELKIFAPHKAGWEAKLARPQEPLSGVGGPWSYILPSQLEAQGYSPQEIRDLASPYQAQVRGWQEKQQEGRRMAEEWPEWYERWGREKPFDPMGLGGMSAANIGKMMAPSATPWWDKSYQFGQWLPKQEGWEEQRLARETGRLREWPTLSRMYEQAGRPTGWEKWIEETPEAQAVKQERLWQKSLPQWKQPTRWPAARW